MTGAPSKTLGQLVVSPSGLDELLGVLIADGYEVLGPTVRAASIVIEPISRSEQLPRGWRDDQAPGRYRLVEREDAAFFAFAAPAATWKRYVFPPRSVLWRSRREGNRIVIEQVTEEVPRRAFFGIRACDLAALAVQDAVFLRHDVVDPVYEARRAGLFIVAVNCSDPAATCFCTSMGTGPVAHTGADLVLTELDPGDPDRHRFLVEPVTERGGAVAALLSSLPAKEADLESATRVSQVAAARMGRSIDTTDLPRVLRAAADHPRWDDVARRCLACGNCTMACPTCFCADVTDEPGAGSGIDERVRQWASCFQLEHSYIHGGSVRVTTKSRYRQWLTHKLSTWWDQFGMSGCVGCGRCIAWCPVGIDITEEVAALRGSAGAPGGREEAT